MALQNSSDLIYIHTHKYVYTKKFQTRKCLSRATWPAYDQLTLLMYIANNEFDTSPKYVTTRWSAFASDLQKVSEKGHG